MEAKILWAKFWNFGFWQPTVQTSLCMSFRIFIKFKLKKIIKSKPWILKNLKFTQNLKLKQNTEAKFWNFGFWQPTVQTSLCMSFRIFIKFKLKKKIKSKPWILKNLKFTQNWILAGVLIRAVYFTFPPPGGGIIFYVSPPQGGGN